MLKPKNEPQSEANKPQPAENIIDEKKYFDGYRADFPLASNYYRLGVPSTD